MAIEKKVPNKKRIFKGEVVSVNNQKTLVAKVDSYKTNSKYLKRFVVTKKYKVHDEKNQYKVGDTVNFIECRPLSKEKRWTVLYK